jgi:hypothetical protein
MRERERQCISVKYFEFRWEQKEIKSLKVTNFNKAKPYTVRVFP